MTGALQCISIDRYRRHELEALIDHLIDLLDNLDGDPDLEDGGDDEPSIGSIPIYGVNGIEHDLELDASDEEPSGDENEPTLGWSNPMV